jgi:peptidoglycan hydrolase CwlO-like protein
MSLHRWFAGFFLLLLMVAALITNAILFSARSFQHNLAAIDAKSGGVVVYSELESIKTQVQQLQNQAAPLMGEAQQLEAKVAAAQREVDTARENVAREQSRVMASLLALESTANITQAADASTVFDQEEIVTRAKAIEAARTLPSETRQAAGAVRTAATSASALEEAIGPKEEALSKAQIELRLIGEQIATSNNQILGLKARFGDDFDRVYAEAQALKRSSPAGIAAFMATMHPTFLSTILAIIMGALGAVLFLFPAYLNPSNQVTFVVIIVRLVFGMVAALAFYIVANVAGVALTSGNAGVTVGTDLNPFMVAFLGIIAGIMADDIAKWIHERGREILGGGAAPPPPAQVASTAYDPGGIVNPRGGPEDPYR